MIEAKNINFAYRRGIPVLTDINCAIGDGEFVALLGHNGSGKTTLTRLMMALDHPRSGQILVDGDDIAHYEPADLADKIGYVFQNPDLQILADTVYVLSARPARILHRVDVPFFAERGMSLKSSGQFRAVEQRLLDLLYAGS